MNWGMSTPTGFTALVANRIQDARGNLLTGQLVITPTDANDKPLASVAGGVGGPVVDAGVFSYAAGVLEASAWVPSSSLTTNANTSYRFTFKDANGVILKVWKAVQPTGPSLSLDTYQPNVSPQAVIQTGPPGTQGIPGPSGPGASNVVGSVTALKSVATTNITQILGGINYVWLSGDFTGKTDDYWTVASSTTPVTSGAWRAQSETGAVVATAYASLVSSGDWTTALLSALAHASVIGVPVILPAGSYLVSQQLTSLYGIEGSGPMPSILQKNPAAASYWATGKALLRDGYTNAEVGASGSPAYFDGNTRHSVYRNLRIVGLASRLSAFTANSALWGDRGPGFLFDQTSHGCKAENIDVAGCLFGYSMSSVQSNQYLDNCNAGDNWIGCEWVNGSGGQRIQNCDWNGNFFSALDIAANNTTGVNAGLVGVIFDNVRFGFSPYGITQASGGTNIAMLGVSFKNCPFESIGNRAIDIRTCTSGDRYLNSVVFENCDVTFNNGYSITGDSGHPVQDYSFYLQNIQGPMTFTNFNSGPPVRTGSTGYAIRASGVDAKVASNPFDWDAPSVGNVICEAQPSYTYPQGYPAGGTTEGTVITASGESMLVIADFNIPTQLDGAAFAQISFDCVANNAGSASATYARPVINGVGVNAPQGVCLPAGVSNINWTFWVPLTRAPRTGAWQLQVGLVGFGATENGYLTSSGTAPRVSICVAKF